jgi:hypothetical protein
MTSRFPVASDLHVSVTNTASSTARGADEGPYARPTLPPHRAVDAVLIDAIRASVGPFVPAPFRTASAATPPADTRPVSTTPVSTTPASVGLTDTRVASVDHEADALPWIESFLEASEGDNDDATLEQSAVDASLVPESELALETDGADTTEEWPLEEAGAAIRAISDDLARHAEAASAPSDDATQSVPDAAAPSLRMWNDDDMMDIMPVKAALPEAEGAEQWAARARRESEEGSPESAARALEALASRVRSGEIQLPMFSAEMGEAAALAAALAALLNLRR